MLTHKLERASVTVSWDTMRRTQECAHLVVPDPTTISTVVWSVNDVLRASTQMQQRRQNASRVPCIRSRGRGAAIFRTALAVRGTRGQTAVSVRRVLQERTRTSMGAISVHFARQARISPALLRQDASHVPRIRSRVRGAAIFRTVFATRGTRGQTNTVAHVLSSAAVGARQRR